MNISTKSTFNKTYQQLTNNSVDKDIYCFAEISIKLAC